jgi:hypothetical protein
VNTRWGQSTAPRLKLKLALVSATAAAMLGVGLGLPASGALETSLDECLRNGGIASGKYCSGGLYNGSLIREFILAGEEQVKRLTDGQAQIAVPVGNAELQHLMARLSPQNQRLLLEYLGTHPEIARYFGL